MQALENDFVLIEEKHLSTPLTTRQILTITNRRKGVGCDQLILIKNSPHADADLSFFNADGSKAKACGNGTRCVAKYLDKEQGTLQTSSFLSQFWKRKEKITVSLKQPTFGQIRHLPRGLNYSYKIDVGNPHLVIFTETPDDIDFQGLAYGLQPPQGINVELAHVLSSNKIQVQVWERGVGVTPACGSGACAVGILSIKLGLVAKSPVHIKMEGGELEVKWEEGSPPLLTGPADFCFKGMLTLP